MTGADHYSALSQSTFEMSELVFKTLDHDATDIFIGKWLDYQNSAYWEQFRNIRQRNLGLILDAPNWVRLGLNDAYTGPHITKAFGLST
ncbi:hypothetical protein EDD16DRAFT_1715172 [Pisolithus croceorrhizus]|nr:hypothetical protein EDD16DRAFT_1715172 [Pisolithus croceorrhizus]KAI6104672.1 hypothetical protein EV401DRAFT_2079047 [Pisolithus croceorrhizus]KAI6168527.1 hypothetical protein EDD17DRAFT_1750067 [Pisolithus thermaeus]